MLKVVNNFVIKIKMESVTLQRTCEIQFVNRAWFGEIKFEERISGVHNSVGKAN